MKLFVVDKDKGPVKGVVVFLTGPDKTKYYAEPTDSDGVHGGAGAGGQDLRHHLS